MRQADPPVCYLVGTPKGRLGKLERQLLGLPWQAVREGVEVKLLPQEQELYVLAQSRSRIHKERAMRRRQLKRLWARLKQLSAMQPQTRGTAHEARRRARQVAGGLAPGRYRACCAGRRVQLRAQSHRSCAKCAGARAAICCAPICVGKTRPSCGSSTSSSSRSRRPSRISRTTCGLRPIYHQLEQRIEAHIFIAFLAYCLHVTLRARLKPLAGGLTPRAVLDKLAAVQMLDVHFPTTDGRTLILSRYTELNADQKLLMNQLRLTLPPQPPPRITAAGQLASAHRKM